MSPAPKRPILIAGPTASGKSALALAIARRVGGVVINADSMQVYRELRIMTARPSAEEMGEVPHRLYGHVPGAEAYSAARFAGDAVREIGLAADQGRVPIVVGGTGLYFKALTEGLSPIPDIPDEVRAYWRGVAANTEASELHAMLAVRDPVAAERLVSTDRQRVTRALEVIEATGRSIAEWQKEPGCPVIPMDAALRLVLRPDRGELISRCDLRFDQMMQAGALEEVEQFLALDIPSDRPIWGALGTKALARHIRGEANILAAVEAAKSETRQFAKRQQTWLKRFMITWNVVQLKYMERNLGCDDSFIDSLLQPA